MKFVIDKTLNTKEYSEPMRHMMTPSEWSGIRQDKSLNQFHDLIDSNEKDIYYTIEVKNTPLIINHREIMETGMDYLLKYDVVVDLMEYFDEYNMWYNSFRMKLNSKSEVNYSKENLSSMDEVQLDKLKNFTPGQTQYLNGWMRHLGKMIRPDEEYKVEGDKTGVYSSLFKTQSEYVSEVTSSNSTD